MENSQHDLHRRFMLLRVHVHGNAASVVNHRNAVVGVNRDDNFTGIACKRFVNTVVNDFIHKVMQPALPRIADIHAGTFSDGLQAFQNSDIACGIIGRRLHLRCLFGGNFIFCHHTLHSFLFQKYTCLSSLAEESEIRLHYYQVVYTRMVFFSINIFTKKDISANRGG